MLLAESGSTKTEWYYENQEGFVLSWSTEGYNPNVQTPTQIKSQLQKDLLPLKGWKPETIVFYGSGFSVPEYCDFLESLFHENWKKANVEVYHDLLGAARGTLLFEPGIACILGTGSNSCQYDGKNIVRQEGGWGYLFGDEGSGFSIGRKLVKGILDNRFSNETKSWVMNDLGLTPTELKNHMYAAAKPNVAVAALSKTVHRGLFLEELKGIVEESLQEFFTITLDQYKIEPNETVAFTGSIAFLYTEMLKKLAKSRNIDKITVVQYPLENLKLFHGIGKKNN